MAIASDVNIIFCYSNPEENRHMAVVSFLSPFHRQDGYILLNEVKGSFIYTHSNYLKEACVCIEKAILELRNDRKRTTPLSSFALSRIVDGKIREKIQELSKRQYSSFETINTFVAKLLAEFSIPTLYNEPTKLGDFKEKYLTHAELESQYSLNIFLKKFKYFETIEPYELSETDDWMDKLQKFPGSIFCNKQDIEDMRIGSELIAFNCERDLIDFVTMDNEFHRSLCLVIQKLKIKMGKIKKI